MAVVDPLTTSTAPDLSAFGASFQAFHARFADLFARAEPRTQSELYLRGLLGPVERRNGWQLAEAVGQKTPDSMQRLLNHARWSAVQARNRLTTFIVETFGDPGAIAILDETGFIKKGDKSVGVARMYSGAAGRIENCQIGVFLAYDTRQGVVLLDRALYMPESWCKDAERRERAHVPSRVRFHTKSELGMKMLRRAWRQGVPMAWVTGDEIYGDNAALRRAIDKAGRHFVLAVSNATHVWLTRPEVVLPRPNQPGRPQRLPRLAPGQPLPSKVRDIARQLPASSWHRRSVSNGEKGPIEYDWAAVRVVEAKRRRPQADRWLLVRRSVSDPSELAYYLSNAPEATSLEKLAYVASRRWNVEYGLELGKDDVGMDQYEVRTWPAWHRHITLSMMALAWLQSIRSLVPDTPPAPRAQAAKKGGLATDSPSRWPLSP